jgi:hypothetical protein
MTEPRSSPQHSMARQKNAYVDLASRNVDLWAIAGRTTYREEFHRDYGPDADEQIDGTESGREF